MNKQITSLIDQATTNLRVKQIWDQAGMTWDMQWEKLAEKAEGKGISVVPYIVTGSGLNLMPEFNKYEFAKLIIQECMRMCDVAAVGYETHGHMKEANGCTSAKEYISEHFGDKE